MVRRLILGAVIGIVLVAGLVAPAAAQEEPVSPATVAPQVITPEPEVRGVTVARPLPRTGNDFGIQVVVGAGLTAAGLAFAVTARRRRQRVLSVTAA